MEEALVFIEANQTWIYVALGILAIIYLRSVLSALGRLRSALFGLERERASEHLTRAGAMLAITLALGLAVFILATFAAPAIPAAARPTIMPTVSLLATAEGGPPAEGEQFAPATPLDAAALDQSGCTNPEATISEPEHEASVSGIVEIVGTADISNFAFYKYEFRSMSADSIWQAIGAGTSPIRDGLLGTWDTSLVPAGSYALRLVVTDAQGNAPFPCTLALRITAGQGGP